MPARDTDRILRRAMFGLALIGLAVASYLTYTHYANVQVACSFGGQCETVQHSAYSKLAGIPVALIGLIGYVVGSIGGGNQRRYNVAGYARYGSFFTRRG